MRVSKWTSLLIVMALVLAMSGVAFGQTKVVYWQHFAEARVAAMEELAREFEKQNPDIKIEIEATPWAAYFDKLFTSVAAGTGPDVFQAPMGLADEFIQSGRVVPLSVPPSEVLEDFLPWTVERLIHDDQLWGIPTDIQSIVLFYNATMFAEAGLDPDRPPADWAELVEYADLLTERDRSGNIMTPGLVTGYYPIVLEALMLQAGITEFYNEEGTEALFNTPEAVEALEYMTDFTMKHSVEHPEVIMENAFALGFAAMTLGHPVSAGNYERMNPDLDFRIAMLPPKQAGEPPVTAGTHWQYFITDRASHEAAEKWVLFLGSEYAQRVFNRVAADLVSREALLSDPEIRIDPNRATALDSLQYATPLTWIGWAQPYQLYLDAIESVIYGQASPQQAMDTLVAEINSILAR